MSQSVDRYGAADYLELSDAQVAYRIKAGTFPIPDAIENEVSWWDIETLDKYRRAQARTGRKRHVRVDQRSGKSVQPKKQPRGASSTRRSRKT